MEVLPSGPPVTSVHFQDDGHVTDTASHTGSEPMKAEIVPLTYGPSTSGTAESDELPWDELHRFPAPSEADIAWMRSLGMRRKAVQSWFSMSENPYFTMLAYFATGPLLIGSLGYLFVWNGNFNKTASLALFIVPGLVGIATVLSKMLFMWVLGPVAKSNKTFIGLHWLITVVVGMFGIGAPVAPEDWIPFQHRFLCIIAGSVFFIVAIFSGFFDDPMTPQLRLTGSLGGIGVASIHSLVSTFKVVNLQTDFALMGTLLRLVCCPTFTACVESSTGKVWQPANFAK